MRTRFMAATPDDIEMTFKIEGTAKEFTELLGELERYKQRALPAPLTNALTDELRNLIVASRKVLHASDVTPPTVLGSFMGHDVLADPAMPQTVFDALKRRINDNAAY